MNGEENGGIESFYIYISVMSIVDVQGITELEQKDVLIVGFT